MKAETLTKQKFKINTVVPNIVFTIHDRTKPNKKEKVKTCK